MNLHHLGEQIDIHGGGNDLIFPHHENEIAQTESLTGKQFARYWIHNGMLQLGGEKMSKSLGNIISIKEFLAKRDADVMRMLVLNGSYRAPLMFNDETLDAAEKGLERIKSALRPASAKTSTAPAEALSALSAQVECHPDRLHLRHGRRLQHRRRARHALRPGARRQHGPRRSARMMSSSNPPRIRCAN